MAVVHGAGPSPPQNQEGPHATDALPHGTDHPGLGRGLGNVEYSGFRIDQGEGRERFVEYAELLLNGLEQGYLEGGKTIQQPKRDIRPLPFKSFKGRTYAAAVSPESMPIMAKLGVGLLVIPQKPWDVVQQDFAIYRDVYVKENGCEPPQPFCGGFIIGYLIYDYIHYSTHHFPMRSGLAKYLKHYHLKHHYSGEGGRYGVSSPLWDWVFGTDPSRG